MATFEKKTLNVTILTGKADVLEQTKHCVNKLYPFHEYAAYCPDFGTLNEPKKYHDLYFISGENYNYVLKTGTEKCLAFSTHVPSVNATIPIKFVTSNDGNAEYESDEITVSRLIKLSANCFVINPNKENELILVTPEEATSRRIGY